MGIKLVHPLQVLCKMWSTSADDCVLSLAHFNSSFDPLVAVTVIWGNNK